MKYLYTKKLVKIRIEWLCLKSGIGVFLTKKGMNDAQTGHVHSFFLFFHTNINSI